MAKLQSLVRMLFRLTIPKVLAKFRNIFNLTFRNIFNTIVNNVHRLGPFFKSLHIRTATSADLCFSSKQGMNGI